MSGDEVKDHEGKKTNKTTKQQQNKTKWRQLITWCSFSFRNSDRKKNYFKRQRMKHSQMGQTQGDG